MFAIIVDVDDFCAKLSTAFQSGGLVPQSFLVSVTCRKVEHNVPIWRISSAILMDDGDFCAKLSKALAFCEHLVFAIFIQVEDSCAKLNTAPAFWRFYVRNLH